MFFTITRSHRPIIHGTNNIIITSHCKELVVRNKVNAALIILQGVAFIIVTATRVLYTHEVMFSKRLLSPAQPPRLLSHSTQLSNGLANNIKLLSPRL